MPQRSPTQIFELFFTPRFPLYFLLGALALGVAGNMLSDLAKQWLAPNGEPGRLGLILVLAIIGLGLLVALAYSAGAIQRRMVGPAAYRVVDRPHPKPARGLIAFVSLKQREHLERALHYHGPALERVWLVATPDAEALAAEIKAEYETGQRRVSVEPLNDPYELLRAREVVEHIYRSQLGDLPEEAVVADFTGGTKPMAAGMIFACLNPRRSLQYVPARYHDGKVAEPLDPVEYVIDLDAVGIIAAEPQGVSR